MQAISHAVYQAALLPKQHLKQDRIKVRKARGKSKLYDFLFADAQRSSWCDSLPSEVVTTLVHVESFQASCAKGKNKMVSFRARPYQPSQGKYRNKIQKMTRWEFFIKFSCKSNKTTTRKTKKARVLWNDCTLETKAQVREALSFQRDAFFLVLHREYQIRKSWLPFPLLVKTNFSPSPPMW